MLGAILGAQRDSPSFPRALVSEFPAGQSQGWGHHTSQYPGRRQTLECPPCARAAPEAVDVLQGHREVLNAFPVSFDHISDWELWKLPYLISGSVKGMKNYFKARDAPGRPLVLTFLI